MREWLKNTVKIDIWCLTTFVTLFCIPIYAVSSEKCALPQYLTAPSAIVIPDKQLIVLTHPSKTFDPTEVAAHGMAEVEAYAQAYALPIALFQSPSNFYREGSMDWVFVSPDKAKQMPYLNPDPPEKYYISGCNVKYRIPSNGGEIATWTKWQFGETWRKIYDYNLLKQGEIAAQEIISAGGNFDLCQGETLKTFLSEWSKDFQPSALKYTVVMNASYTFIDTFSEVLENNTEMLAWFKKTFNENFNTEKVDSYNKILLLDLRKILGEDKFLNALIAHLDRKIDRESVLGPLRPVIVISVNGKPIHTISQGERNQNAHLEIDFVDTVKDITPLK